MEYRGYKFDRLEFAGSLGDLGVIIPLSVALITITGVNATVVLTSVGLLYIATGLYYKLPVPVQPLKVVAAVTIASHGKITPEIMAATGITFGLLLLIMSWSGLINWIEKLFTKPVIVGIQVGLGLLLLMQGINFISKPAIFSNFAGGNNAPSIHGVSINLIIGLVSAGAALFLLASKRFPAAIVVVVGGIFIGLLFGDWSGMNIAFGPEHVKLYFPGPKDFLTAAVLLVIPQFPLSIGNAIVGMSETAVSLFGKNESTKRATTRSFAASMGIANLAVGFFAGMPMCHGAGGLAAHYRFGARTGGSNLMIGTVFVILGLVFGKMSLAFLQIIPNGVLGALLLFAGLELTVLIKNVSGMDELFVVFLIVGIGLATTNMGIAFFVGIIVHTLIRKGLVKTTAQ